MATHSFDSFFELEFNGDQTQVFATIHPPRGAGRMSTTEEVVQRLKNMGVIVGIREGDITRALNVVQSTNVPIARTLVAQGTMPVDGTDAQINWHISFDAASQPLPRSGCGATDYDAVPQERFVKVGQVLASVKPAIPGSPGKTLTAPLKTIPVAATREVPFNAGNGVSYSVDRLQFTATTDGILEIQGDRIQVHAIQWIQGDLNNVTEQYPGGVVIKGDVTASTIRAGGAISISGTVAGCMLRAKGDVIVHRCARTKILADGDVYVLGKLLHSQVICPKRLTSAAGSVILGGSIIATQGIQAANVGAPDGTKTCIVAAMDRYSYYRQQEVEAEIAQHEENIQKIARALRPLSSAASQEAVPEQKRQLVQTLVAQRRHLEERVRELHHEKRSLILASKSRVDAEISIAGTIYGGVTVQLDAATATVEHAKQSVRCSMDSFRDSVVFWPLEEAIAA